MSLAPFHLPEPLTLTVDLPFPPSVNVLWRQKKGGGVYLSTEYRRWIRQADLHLMANRSRPNHTIAGPCSAELLLNIEGGMGDSDNRIKAVLDYAQRIRLVDNDKLVMRGTWAWVKPALAPRGCRLILRELAG